MLGWIEDMGSVSVSGCYSIEVCVLICLSRVRLCKPMDYSLPGSSLHGILQARILEWVAKPSSRGSSQPGDRTSISLCLLN